jgi:hypothetical protein
VSVFDLDTHGQETLAEQARLNPISIDDVATGAFHGAGKGTGLGLMRGFARVGQTVGMAGGALIQMAGPPVEPVSSERLDAYGSDAEAARERVSDAYFGKVDEYANNAVDYWAPSHAEVGKAGQVLGGFAEIVGPLMAAGGNPALLIGTQEMGQATDLARQGVDAGTAVRAGVIQGAASAAGFKLPFLGSTLATRMASGAIGNAAVNTWAAATQRAWLESDGYKELAAQYDPNDLEARAVDVLSGLAFGGVEHLQARPGDLDAIAVANNAKHFQRDTAPGAPADLAASVAHQDALETAIDQLMKGEPVSVPAEVSQAQFTPRDRSASANARQQAFEDEFGKTSEEVATGPQILRAENLPPAERAIENRFREQVGSDVGAAIDAYAKLGDSQGGKVLNTDVARELSPEYLKDRTLSAAVHEPASWLVKQMYARKLAESPGPGEEPLVIFSAGGTGAGKTSGLAAVPEATRRAQIIYDTNMNKLSGAVEKIDQALAAGKDVDIIYTYREPIEALKNGALPRAVRQEKQFGSGRTVPVDEHIATHVGSHSVIEQIAAHYAHDPRVTVRAVDNSRGKGNQALVKLGEIPKAAEGAYDSIRERALQTLEAEHAAGRISDAVYRGFAGTARARPEAGSSGGLDRAGDRGRPQEADGGGRVEDPLTAAVQASLDEADIQVPTGETDANGNPVTRSAREILQEADAEIAKAEIDGKGIMAAVTCFLQRGT